MACLIAPAWTADKRIHHLLCNFYLAYLAGWASLSSLRQALQASAFLKGHRKSAKAAKSVCYMLARLAKLCSNSCHAAGTMHNCISETSISTHSKATIKTMALDLMQYSTRRKLRKLRSIPGTRQQSRPKSYALLWLDFCHVMASSGCGCDGLGGTSQALFRWAEHWKQGKLQRALAMCTLRHSDDAEGCR